MNLARVAQAIQILQQTVMMLTTILAIRTCIRSVCFDEPEPNCCRADVLED